MNSVHRWPRPTSERQFVNRRPRPALTIALLTSLVALGCGALGCGDNSKGESLELVCAGGASGTVGAGNPVAVGSDGVDLRGAAVDAQVLTTLPSELVSIGCASDINPTGTIALGPAVTFSPANTRSDRAFVVTLPYKAARLPPGAGRRNLRVVAVRHVGDGSPFFPIIANRSIDDQDQFASRLTFRAHELATYQVVADDDAGQTETRRYTYRAVAGISMGGSASMTIGLKHHEMFDLIVDLGGEPGPSMKYSLDMVRDYLFGGFCTAADEAAGMGPIGSMCPGSQRPTRSAEFELGSNFENMLYQDGDGVGLTLKRSLYVKAARDLSRAYGNPANYNPENAYLPPGVPRSWLALSSAERCANSIVLKSVFDEEFNPTGESDVITFCDGVDSEEMGLGVFNPALDQDSPIEILLAVDLNGNGVRDAGEPVITNSQEPFADVGPDGLADEDETGSLGAFDAATNPDPAGDNYDSLVNPLGTEGNGDYDEGESFRDVGLDGVEGSCQAGETPTTPIEGCYDFGEGDGEFTVSPNLLRWYESDLDVRMSTMTDDERRRINIWNDAGIRDFLNASVSVNASHATMMAKYQLEGAAFDQFGPMNGEETDAGFDFFAIPWDELPRNLFVRYGNPDADEATILRGDGRHVGTAVQLVNRVTTSFTWLDHHWPNGDRDDVDGSGQVQHDNIFTSPSTGRETPWALFLPPGYSLAENADRRYPIVYFLHGYGQEPSDLIALSGIFENYMVNRSVPNEERFQKFIMVYVDGRCRPNQTGVPVPAGGDGCEGGTFYLDSPLGGPAQMETNMLELMEFVEANFRTKREEMVEIVK